MTQQARENFRLILILTMMVAIAGIAMFATARQQRINNEDTKVNRDGISCIIEELNAHRQNSYASDAEDAQRHKDQLMVPAPAPKPLPRELLAACDRFLQAP